MPYRREVLLKCSQGGEKMRFLWILMFVAVLGLSALGQNDEKENFPVDSHPDSYVYTNSNDLKERLAYSISTLKSEPDLKIYIIFHAGSKKNTIKFDDFKQKTLKILVKSNKIAVERVSVVNAGSRGDDTSEYRFVLVDKNVKQPTP